MSAPGLDIRFNLLGDKDVRFRLGVRANAVKDLSRAWPRVREIMVDVVRKQFDSQGGRGPAGAWSALSPKYALRKAAKFPGAKILVASGDMRRSLTEVGGADQVFRTAPLSMEFGTRVTSAGGYPYPRAHQHGAPGASLPRRRIFDFSTKRDTRQIVRVLHVEIDRTVGIADRGFTRGARAARAIPGPT